MQIMIDISEDKYKRITEDAHERMYCTHDMVALVDALTNGTPLDEWQTEAFKNGWKEGFGMGKQDLAHKVIKLFEEEKV